jgi:hypothetical protein
LRNEHPPRFFNRRMPERASRGFNKETAVKRLFPIFAILFFVVPTAAAFPPVPESATALTLLSKFEGGSATYLLWAQDGEFYLHIDPIGAYYNLSVSDWHLSQGGSEYTDPIFEASDGTEPDNEALYSGETFRVHKDGTSEPWVDYSLPFTAVYREAYLFEITPLAPSAIIPDSGIWKSSDGLLSMYLQKYDTGSAVIVVTVGDAIYTAFLDPDYTDGIDVSDDVDGRGYALSLEPDRTDAGSVTVTLHGYGKITREISLAFGGI